jgi:hypothetical protein
MTKILYYEVEDSRGFVVGLRGNYFSYTAHGWSARSGNSYGPPVIGYAANRVWEWDSDTDVVRYIKNRETGRGSEVNKNEFLLVQLKAKEYKDEIG